MESLSFRRDFRRFCTFYKIKTEGAPEYLYKLIPVQNNTYDTRSTLSVGINYCRTNSFKYSFFPNTIRESQKLDLHLAKFRIFQEVQKPLINFARPSLELILRIRHPLGLKSLPGSKLSLSHPNENLFKHNSKSCINPLCTYPLKIKPTKNFFFSALALSFSTPCLLFLNDLCNI